jgi:hypothetical protein
MTVLALSDTVLNVQITKTADGKYDLLQIRTPELFLSVEMIAGVINLSDLRTSRRRKKKGETP